MKPLAPLLLVGALSLIGACPSPGPNIDFDGGPPEDAGRSSTGGSIAWSDELPNPYLFPDADDEDGVITPNAFDFFLAYTVELPEPNTPASTLTTEVCMKRASDAEPFCDAATVDAVAGEGGYRWGFDPSQYDTGLNIYEHKLTLEQEGVVVAEETLRFEVTAP